MSVFVLLVFGHNEQLGYRLPSPHDTVSENFGNLFLLEPTVGILIRS